MTSKSHLILLSIISLGIQDGRSQTAGPAPTGSIQLNDGTITAGGDKVVPVGGTIDLSGSATDTDCDSSNNSVADTFSAPIAYEWSERNGKGIFASSSSASTSFTAPSTAGTVEIVLKVKDDGTPYQDNSSATEVASKVIKAVYPDGVRSTATRGSFYDNYISGTINWQVTYKSVDLPWVGYLAERVGINPFPMSFTKVYNLPFSFVAQAPGGSWIYSGNFGNPTNSVGNLDDFHASSCPTPGPAPAPTPLTTGKYRDASSNLQIGFVKPDTGATLPLGSQGFEEYTLYTSSIDGVFQKH